MDINARVNWRPGMEVDSALLSKVEDLSENSRKALCHSFFGRACVSPDSKVDIYACFVDKQLEIDVRSLHAVLPSGILFDFDGQAAVPVNNLPEGVRYVCAGLGEDVEFECEGVPCVRKSVVFSILAPDEVGTQEVIPLVKLVVGGGSVEIDREYIVPVFRLSSDPRLLQWRDRVVSGIDGVLGHPKLADGDIRRFLSLMRSRLVRLPENGRVEAFVSWCSDLVEHLGAFLLDDGPGMHEWTEDTYLDLVPALKHTEEVLARAVTALDNLEIEDDGVDIDAIKEEIRLSVMEQLRADLLSEIGSRMSDMEASIAERLSADIREAIPEEVDKLRDGLRDELSGRLQESLYPSLYDALYSALFVPREKTDDIFTPVI